MAKFRGITDERMFRVADYVVKNKIKGIKSYSAWAEAIGMHQSVIASIKSGRQSCTVEHILATCKQFNISADYIYGLTSDMFRKAATNPIEKMEQALAELKQQSKVK